MNSFTAEIGSRGYHVYRETTWKNIVLHQQVTVLKETNSMSIDIDPYCCRITIKRVYRIGDITVGHIPRELSRFVFYFIHEGGSVTGTVANLTPRPSPIPEGGIEIPIIMHFAHVNKAILSKMETFVNKQVQKMKEKFDFEQLIGEETREEEDEIDEEDAIEVQSDDEEDNVESNETVVID